MDTPRAVWIDFCCVSQQRSLCNDAQVHCNALRVTRLADISGAVAGHRPQFLCIEYDYPDHARLQALPLLRRGFPALPMVMFTEYHSEALAIWAFRWRVWDYRVKPVSSDALARLLGVVARIVAPARASGWRFDPLPAELLAPAGQLHRPLMAAPRTAAAVAWISEHYGEPVRVTSVAELCHLSESEFSRVFHREHGSSFRRFLLQYRIARARDFLADPETSVSQVAYAVGFNDLSYFGRVFRRVVGIPATRYQQHLQQ
jgi:AraC-like DNA-binding protein